MTAPAAEAADAGVRCSDCEALCCRLEVLLIGDTGVPERFVEYDERGAARMARGSDGWCAALDRGTMSCTIYTRRPWICREYRMGGPECLEQRATRRPSPGAVPVDPPQASRATTAAAGAGSRRRRRSGDLRR